MTHLPAACTGPVLAAFLPVLPWAQLPALFTLPRARQCRACPAGVSSSELCPTRGREEGLCSAHPLLSDNNAALCYSRLQRSSNQRRPRARGSSSSSSSRCCCSQQGSALRETFSGEWCALPQLLRTARQQVSPSPCF